MLPENETNKILSKVSVEDLSFLKSTEENCSRHYVPESLCYTITFQKQGCKLDKQQMGGKNKTLLASYADFGGMRWQSWLILSRCSNRWLSLKTYMI